MTKHKTEATTETALVTAAHGRHYAVELPGGELLHCYPRGKKNTYACGDIVDFDMCWAFELADPWGNQYELNCYDYDRVRRELVEADGITPMRYWPRELYDAHIKP